MFRQHYVFVLITCLSSQAICGSIQACSISVCCSRCAVRSVRGLTPCHPLPVAPPHCPHWALPLCLAALLVLGAVTHLDDCVRSGHYWRYFVALHPSIHMPHVTSNLYLSAVWTTCPLRALIPIFIGRTNRLHICISNNASLCFL